MGLILTFTLSGCATIPQPVISEPELLKLQNRISVLEEELKRKDQENLSLKEKIAELERMAIRMPTAKEIQIALKNAGFYEGEIDGKIGSKTKEAIIKFQEAKGINPDGVVGSRTWQILSKYLNYKSE
jgi:peptidoglycan hydrolase-like protein with peptidoglycan-binding domain